MNISAWSIRNPVPTILLFVLLTLLGISSFNSLSIQNIPDVDLPTITVTASLEGAAPSQLETEVARKLEDRIFTLGGVQNIHTKITDSSVFLTVEFDLDSNSETALTEVRNAVERLKADLPPDIDDLLVSKVSTAGGAIVTFTVQSDRLDEEDLSWFVDNEVKKAVLAVKGVGAITRVGGVDREVSVELDPAKMGALGVTAADISYRLKQVQQDASGGRGDIGGAIQAVRTLAVVDSIQDIVALDIPLGDGRSVRLSDVAKIQDTIAERSSYTLLDGQSVVAFNVTRLKGASEIEVVNAVRSVAEELQNQFPLVDIVEASNTIDVVQDNYVGSMALLYEGALLAILVVWLFLRDWRATIISSVALPLSIIPAFAIMYYFDFSLNMLTLLALALVVGVLVDDAIVEVENIVRHLRMGKSPLQASIDATDEIGLAVIATTMTLVAVFLPTAFMGGVAGKFFMQFGLTAAIAILTSLLVARMLTPMMAAYFLRDYGEEKSESALKRRYLVMVNWCIRHRKTTVTSAVLFFVGSLFLAASLPTGFIPAADRNQTVVNIELPPGSTLAETLTAAKYAYGLIEQVPEITNVFTSVGLTGGADPFGQDVNTDVRKATLVVNLKHRHDRQRSQAEVENDLRNRLISLPGARIAVGASDGHEKLQIVLQGDDAAVLSQTAHSVIQDIRTLSNIGNVSSSASLQRPEIHVLPDFALAADMGITTAALASAVRVATSGDFEVKLPKLNLPERQIPIRVRLDESVRKDIEALKNLRVASYGGLIPLSAVAEITLSSGPSQIDRLDRKRNVSIDIELAGNPLGEVQTTVNALPTLKQLPPGISQPAFGDAKQMEELFGSFGYAMLIGILCIYIVLVLLFHEFLQPVTLLAALPLSVGGAFMGLMITNNSFSMPAVIGLLMLMGIVTKNSILLVEYTITARREYGLNRYDALLDACNKRARPIIMTTIAMSAGMLPVAIGIGAESSFRSPMAISVIGGLLTSTFLSLLVIPVVFTYVDDLSQMLKRYWLSLYRRDINAELKLSPESRSIDATNG